MKDIWKIFERFVYLMKDWSIWWKMRVYTVCDMKDISTNLWWKTRIFQQYSLHKDISFKYWQLKYEIKWYSGGGIGWYSCQRSNSSCDFDMCLECSEENKTEVILWFTWTAATNHYHHHTSTHNDHDSESWLFLRLGIFHIAVVYLQNDIIYVPRLLILLSIYIPFINLSRIITKWNQYFPKGRYLRFCIGIMKKAVNIINSNEYIYSFYIISNP